MTTPSFKEDHISQVPALQLLQKLGYTYLSPEEALQFRGNKTTHVILEDVLRKQLKEINSIQVSSAKTTLFSDANIEAGIQALKDLPMHEGYMAACETAYNLLTLGKALEQNIDGDKKSFTLQYIDWQNIRNNVFHVTEEFAVMRSTSKEHYRPDLVLFVNGIPLCVIECKRPDMKEPLQQAVSQQLRSQQEDGIRNLYIYAQVILSVAFHEALYATSGSPEKFWSIWREKFDSKDQEKAYSTQLHGLKNQPLPTELKNKLFAERFRYVRSYFDELEKAPVLPSVQDEYLYSICRPERLLDLTFNYIVFEEGIKKIARYPQYFVIKKTIERIHTIETGRRKGGVIWHTQGVGKSLTMVMLGQAIALDKRIHNPKIILVTDRIDLDDQITRTFRKCGIYVQNATTGQRLVELLESNSNAVITTVINKFEAAVKKIEKPLESYDIFVLVDEGHRTQHGTFNVDMQKTLPHACYIAMTGTPLFKKDKSTAAKFGGIVDAYTVDQAVKDKVIVPLLYEGRHSKQTVHEKPLDTFFNLISEPLTDLQKADLKKKFSRAEQLNVAEQKIYAVCWDISHHYKHNFQHLTPFKGQLVCQGKEAAIRYKEFLDEINIVSSEVLISPPDEREGEDSVYAESSDRVKVFWKRMMNEHGTAKKYQNNLINRFKKGDQPEIIIVVDKLLTGFDEPKNTVLYITRNLQEHTLLQAIARINRVYPDKDYGYIIDYYGVIGQLDEALKMYSSFDEFDESDLQGTLIHITEEVKKLPQRYSELWDIFKTIGNLKDAEAYAQLLGDEALRSQFYDKLGTFARILKMALSSVEFHNKTDEKKIKQFKDELAFFLHLRKAVLHRYSDVVDYSQYEGQIQKLIDTHIEADKVISITELVNIFDKEKFLDEVEKTIGKTAKADTIASRTSRHIHEKMDEDPFFYKKFSDMLKEVLADYEAKRINEAQYLNKVTSIMDAILTHTDVDIPDILKDKEAPRAFYGLSKEGLEHKFQVKTLFKTIGPTIAMEIDHIIQKHIVVDWHTKADIPKKMMHLIGDYLIDEVRDKYKIPLTFEEIDSIAEKCVDVAKIRYKK